MNKLLPVVLISSAALIAVTALSASAATTSITVPDGRGPAAVDTSTKLVYVGTAPTPPPNPDHPGQDWNSSVGVSTINPSTKKVVKTVTISLMASSGAAESVSDVKVSSSSNNLWVLAVVVDTGGGCGSRLYQLNKTTLATVRAYQLGCSHKIELDPTSQWAYLAEAPYYESASDHAQPLTKATVVAINGATGAVTRATVPSPTSGANWTDEEYYPISIAFDRKNYGIYVVGEGMVWVYTTKLKLVHVTKLNYPFDSYVSAAANLTTNLIYFSDGKTVTEISGPTGNITRTSALAGGPTMVIDTTSNVLYLGTKTVKLSTLTATGNQAYPVQAVDPSTHARYSEQSTKLYITR